MGNVVRDTLLEGAVRIGLRLVQAASWHGKSCTWHVMTIDPKQSDQYAMIRSPADGSLYQGSAGIGLFLAELWRISGERLFLECASGAMRHATQFSTQLARPCSLYSGAVGIAHVTARFAEMTRDEQWATIPTQLLKQVAAQLNGGASGDLIGGGAGAAIGMLRLSQDLVGDAGLQAGIAIGEQLERDAVVHPYGWAWSSDSWCVKHHLCGYAHGASGYAHAFAELFAATGDMRWQHAATQAMLYERHHRSAESGDWPDFRDMKLWNWSRSTNNGARLREQFRAKNVTPSAIASMRVWCHGAAGIGLTRLRAATLDIDTDRCRGEAHDALALIASSLSETISRGYSICHGVMGNLEALLHGERYGGLALSETARTMALEGVERFELRGAPWPSGVMKNAPDPSLMLGDAGIGLILLQLADPSVPSASFLSRWARQSPSVTGDLSLLRMKDAMTFCGRYATAVSLLPDVPTSATAVGAIASGAQTPQQAFDAMTSAIAAHSCCEKAALLSDALAPEAAYMREHLAFDDYRVQRLEELQTLAVEEIDWSHMRIARAPHAIIVTTKWAWRAWLDQDQIDRPIEPELKAESWIVYRRGSEVVMTPLSPLEALIMDCLREPATMDELHMRVSGAVDLTRSAGEALAEALPRAVRHAVMAGLARAQDEDASPKESGITHKRWRGPVRVGVIDSGWDARWRDARVGPGCSFVGEDGSYVYPPSSDDSDRLGHGTRCTRAILDLAEDIRIVPMRVFGKTLATSSDVLCAALEWATAQRLAVLNLSLSTSELRTRDQLYWLVSRLRARGTIVVSAACNRTGDGYPAVFDNVIGVGIVTAANAKQLEQTALDVTIPAEMLYRKIGNAYGPWSNSLAAAYVSGLVARLVDEGGAIELDDVRAYLRQLLPKDLSDQQSPSA